MTDRLTQLRTLRDQITREIHTLERRYGRPESPDDDAQRLIAHTAARHGVTVDDVLSPSRRRDVVRARQEIAWELRQLNLSYPQIGGLLGRDHSTVLRSIRAVERPTLGGVA